jgi:NhaP-type Na+/H+ or K+/H+ antiporter/K+/H+ antiporter YhaU regulatory subunit KhtT
VAADLLVTIVAILVVGIAGQLLAARLRVPSVVFYLAGGLLLGDVGIGLVSLGTFATETGGSVNIDGLTTIVGISVAVIVFDGAFALRLERVREAETTSLRLVTFGAIVTFAGAAATVHYIVGTEWPIAFLIGALVVATGPTVITPIVNVMNLREHVSTALETEGIINDVTAAIAAVVIFETILLEEQGLPVIGFAFVERLGIGVVVGLVAAGVTYFLLTEDFLPLEGPRAARFIALLAAVASYSVADFFSPEAGVAAAATAGVVLGNLSLEFREEITEFTEDATLLFLGFVFVTLAALVDVNAVLELGVAGIILVLVLMLVIRPLVAIVSTAGVERFTWPERWFIAAVGPRGIIPASVATLFALELEDEAVALREEANELTGAEAAELMNEAAALDDQAQLLLGAVFLVIFATDALQAGFARQIGDILGVTPMRTIIIGGGRVGRSLATQLKQRDEFVIIVESDEEQCRLAREAGLRVIEGNGTEEEVLKRAGIGDAKTVIAATDSDDINLLVCQTAKTKFDIESLYARVRKPENVDTFDSIGVTAVNESQATAYAIDNEIERPAMAHWMNDLGDGHDIIEVEITSEDLSGRPIQALNTEIPGGCIIAEIGQGDDAHVPDPEEVVEYGDTVTFLGDGDAVATAVRRFHPHD